MQHIHLFCVTVFVQLLYSCQGRLVVHLIQRWSGNFYITALTLFQSVSYLLSRGYLRKVYNSCLVPPMVQLMHMATRYQSQSKVLCFLELAGLCTWYVCFTLCWVIILLSLHLLNSRKFVLEWPFTCKSVTQMVKGDE